MSKSIGCKGNLIKETNYKNILKLIGKGEELTKLEIAYALQLSIPTVTTNINTLKEEGIIEEIEKDIYTGGRKPKSIRLVPNARVTIGINITRDKIIMIVMNLCKQVILTKEVECCRGEIIDYINQAKQTIQEELELLKIDEENILGIGISIPGIINHIEGIIEKTNMGSKAIALDKIEEQFNYPVYIENEANLSLLAEKILEESKCLRNVLYIGINEGLGGGLCFNNELYTGTVGRAGEIGHMCFWNKQEQCYQYIEEKVSTRGILRCYEEQTGKIVKEFKDFEELIIQRDSIAIKILMESIELLLVTVYNLTMILDIQTVIIGGKVARLIKSQADILDEILSNQEKLLEKIGIEICFSEIRHTSTLGAALLPLVDFYRINSINK